MKRDCGEKGKTVSRAFVVASTTPPVAADVSPRPKGKPVSRALTSAATGTVLILLAGCLNPGPKFNPYIPGSYQENAFSQVKLTNAVPQTDLLKPSAALFTLGPGDKLELLEEKGEWFHIRLSNGKDGWISSSYAKKE